MFLVSAMLTKRFDSSMGLSLSTGDRKSLWKGLAGDKLQGMKLPARLLLVALTLSVGALSPIVPAEVSFPKSQTSGCCPAEEVATCNSCPTAMGQTPSSFASSCCSTQSTCCSLYFVRTTPFSVSMRVTGAVSFSDERATARAERPPVPPPRSQFS